MFLHWTLTYPFVFKNVFLFYGFFSLVTFMTAHCLCQAPCLWFAEFCYLKIGIALAHFQSMRNFPSYIGFPKITDRSLLIPFENFLCSLSSNMLAKRFENSKRTWVPLHLLINLRLLFSHGRLILFLSVKYHALRAERSKWNVRKFTLHHPSIVTVNSMFLPSLDFSRLSE